MPGYRSLTALFIASLLLLNPLFARAGLPISAGDEVIVLNVDTTIDTNASSYQLCQDFTPNDCSLRGAITHANDHPNQQFKIILEPATYFLTIPGYDDENEMGDLDISGNLELVGQGVSLTTINANQLDRVLQVMPKSNVELRDLTITGGLSAPSLSGGGIYNHGELRLVNSRVTGNHAGDGLPVGPDDIKAGNGGNGGGLYNAGYLILEAGSLISENSAGEGGASGIETGGKTAGDGGDGGGIMNSGAVEILNSNIEQNFAGDGGIGLGDCRELFECDYGSGGNAGSGGHGGGIANWGSISWIGGSLNNNRSGSGLNGGQGTWYGGAGGDGGNGGGFLTAEFFLLKI